MATTVRIFENLKGKKKLQFINTNINKNINGSKNVLSSCFECSRNDNEKFMTCVLCVCVLHAAQTDISNVCFNLD